VSSTGAEEELTAGGVERPSASGVRMSLKKKCCKRYERKGKACKHCPTMAFLSKKERKKFLRKWTE
jgi:hypothetical protein